MRTRYKIINKTILFSTLIILAIPVFASTPAADELTKLLNNTRTMQAKFEQSSINNKGKSIGQNVSGSMILERPGKFRWETTEPNSQLIIVNQDKTLMYDADLEQVVNKKVNRQAPSNPAMLLSSPATTIKQNFKIMKLKSSGKNLWFQLTPKTYENGYQSIKMNFSENRLQTLQITDDLEQKTVVRFKNILLNTALPTKAFIFVPPKGTETFNEE